MAEPRFDVIGIGNAIVDVLAHADDDFLAAEGLTKGAMTLVDADKSNHLYEKLGPAVECSGGSAANTIAGLAALGGAGAFVGKVRDDQLGDVFRHDIRALGVAFDTPASESGPPTATSMILVTPDAQRTMQTFLGACAGLGPDDIDEVWIGDARVIYLEGYLWDPPAAKQAFAKAANAAHQADRKVALTLSDPFCVDRHRDEFLALAEHHVDLLFANEQEIMSLYRTENFDESLQAVRAHCEIAALTRSAKGSVIVSGDEVHVIDAEPVADLVDTTGAGDAYAAGFLFGLTSGRDLAACARIGGIAAAEVISHLGARPDGSLKAVVEEKLG
ncbi:MAG: adenosine kinase [Rhodospirillales bacterium]